MITIGSSFYGGAQTIPDSKECNDKSEWFSQVRKPDEGWNTDFIDKAHKLGHETSMESSAEPAYKDVIRTEYVIRDKYFPWIEVIVNNCDHSVSLRTQHLRVDHIFGFSQNGKTFAYALSGNCGSLEKGVWIAAGCDTSILLLDTKGAGKFDFLHYGAASLPMIPEWVKK